MKERLKMKKQDNCLQVQTNAIPGELTSIELDEIAKGISFYQKNGKYMCQTFFTPPRVGEINWIEGIEKSADMCFRSIRMIGSNLFHVQCKGAEKKVRQACTEPLFFQMLRSIKTTFTEALQSRVYLDTTAGHEYWDALASLDKRKVYLANHVNLSGKKIYIKNIIAVGDRLFGLTEDGRVVTDQLTPQMFEKDDYVMEVSVMDGFSKLGKIDTITSIPNSEMSFLACANNCAYQVDIRGDIARFQTFDDRVRQINHVAFNRVRSLFATNDGLYEIEVEELPQMIRGTSLPRLISHPDLKGSFSIGHYVEDPYILGVHPAVGILAKTENDRVVCF
jgi:hypothetical protein